MKLQVNGKSREVPDRLTVADLLRWLKVKMPEMVSVQLNGTILKRESFPTVVLEEDDEVEFLYFMGGGAFSLPTV